MNNKTYFSGERNNYFFGKLMTVRDFEKEQSYHSNKRRLSNRMLHGVGIVSGMGVLFVDNQTISLEKGMAIDYMGREVIIHESEIKRLNTIDGFDEFICEKTLYLCIEYKEDFKETAFSVSKTSNGSDTGNEYNRIYEGYRLFLTPRKANDCDINLNSIVYTNTMLIDTENLKLSIETPKYCNPKEVISVVVTMEKRNLNSAVKYNFNMESPLFKGENGSNINIAYEEADIALFNEVKNEYHLMCEALHGSDCNLIIKKCDSIPELSDDIVIPIHITTENVRDKVIDKFYDLHFDDIISAKEEQRLYLARLNIISNGSTYFIEEMKQFPFNQHLLSATLINTLNSMDYNRYRVQSLKSENVQADSNVQIVENPTTIPMITTGIQRINLGFSPKANKSFITADIVHGLGNGNIAVVLSLENKRNMLTNEQHVLLFGDGDIFENGTLPSAMPKLKMGAMLYPEKGAMKIGVKLQSPTNLTYVDVRWWAYFCEDDKNSLAETYKDSIRVTVDPSTIQIKPSEQVRFNAVIFGMKNQEVSWSVKDIAGGSIDQNGLYVAPSKEGVYAVEAQSSKYEHKKSTAYIVVKE